MSLLTLFYIPRELVNAAGAGGPGAAASSERLFARHSSPGAG
jgi:hypothetical protein